MYVMFDLDGVLIDSQRVIQAAYEYAGVRCPDHILELEGSTWLEDQVGSIVAAQTVRYVKNAFYIDAMADVPLLPPYHAAVRLKREGIKLGVLTHAPVGTLGALSRAHHDWPFDRECCSERVTTPMKMDILREGYPEGGIYIDDQARAVLNIPPGWTFVHYVAGAMHADHVYNILRARLPEGA